MTSRSPIYEQTLIRNQIFFRHSEDSSPSTSSSSLARTLVRKDDDSGVLGALTDLSVYDNPPSPEPPIEESAPICRQGESGTQ